MASKTVPFTGQPNQRATGTNDRRYVNVLHEAVVDAMTKSVESYVVKRPALANSTRPPGANATGRGAYAWAATGKIYSAFANRLYRGSSDLGVTLAGSSGRVWFEETPPNVSSARTLIVSDGADNYNITMVTDENYLNLPGASGDYASTPNAAPLQITGDISFLVYAVLTDWTPAVAHSLNGKWLGAGDQRAYHFFIQTDGTVNIATTADGLNVVTETSSENPVVSNGQGIWLLGTFDVNDGAGNRVAKFYTYNGAQSAAPSFADFTQLGTTQTIAGVTTIANTTANGSVGAVSAGTVNLTNGKIYRAQIYNGIFGSGGTLVADFDPNNANNGAASFTSVPTGEVYTINGAASIVGATVTQIDENDDAQYPASNLGPIVYLDEMLFQAQSDGDIWNTDVASYIAWSATSVKRTPRKGANLEAIRVQRDQIIAFYKTYIDFYFNNGNPTGSPLLRHEQNGLDFGLAAKETLAWSGSVCMFVGENSAGGDGGRSVWMISSLSKVSEVSNATINRFLRNEGTSISSATAWMERVAGQLIYVLNLSSANRTFVYNVDNPGWCEWEIAAGSAKFNGIAATSLNGTVYVQDATNGRIYTLSPTTFQDSGSNFTVTLQPGKSDLGTDNFKFESELSVVGDTTTGNLNESHSDDDYVTFSTARAIDLSLPHKRLTRLGSFRERAYRYTYADNYALRLQAVRHVYDEGTN